MKNLLTLIAATLFSTQTGYCAGQAFDTLTSLNSKETISAALDTVNAADKASPEKVTQFPAKLNGTFKVACTGGMQLGGIQLNLKIADQNGKRVQLNAEMGKTPVGSEDAMLLLIDAEGGQSPSRLAAWWLMENGGGTDDVNNGYNRGFNGTGVFYDKTDKDDMERELYVRKNAISATDIVAAMIGSSDPNDWLKVSSMATQLKESITAQADGSLLYQYKASGQRTFISDKEVDDAVSGFMKRTMIKARIRQLKGQNRDVSAEGQCLMERVK